MENILIEFQTESTHTFAPHSACFMEFVWEKSVPDTNGKELSPTVDTIRAEYLDGLQE